MSAMTSLSWDALCQRGVTASHKNGLWPLPARFPFGCVPVEWCHTPLIGRRPVLSAKSVKKFYLFLRIKFCPLVPGQPRKLSAVGRPVFLVFLTALQEFEVRLCDATRKGHRDRTASGRVSPVTQTIEISGRRFRIFLANRVIALGWALRGSCKPCAQRLFASARWLVPEAKRFLVHYKGSYNHPRRIFAADLGTLLRHMQSFRVAVGFLIVLLLLGSLELATRATAIGTQPLVGKSAFPVSMQVEPVPLPTRKPQAAYKVPNGKGATAAIQKRKRTAQQKSARLKSTR
jgi:hypothetical protein